MDEIKELNKLAGKKVMGWSLDRVKYREGGHGGWYWVRPDGDSISITNWSPAEKIEQAFMVVTEMIKQKAKRKENYMQVTIDICTDGSMCHFYPKGVTADAELDQPALAILRCVKKVMEV